MPLPRTKGSHKDIRVHDNTQRHLLVSYRIPCFKSTTLVVRLPVCSLVLASLIWSFRLTNVAAVQCDAHRCCQNLGLSNIELSCRPDRSRALTVLQNYTDSSKRPPGGQLQRFVMLLFPNQVDIFTMPKPMSSLRMSMVLASSRSFSKDMFPTSL